MSTLDAGPLLLQLEDLETQLEDSFGKLEPLRRRNEQLEEENELLERALELSRKNSSLNAAVLITKIITWLDVESPDCIYKHDDTLKDYMTSAVKTAHRYMLSAINDHQSKCSNDEEKTRDQPTGQSMEPTVNSAEKTEPAQFWQMNRPETPTSKRLFSSMQDPTQNPEHHDNHNKTDGNFLAVPRIVGVKMKVTHPANMSVTGKCISINTQPVDNSGQPGEMKSVHFVDGASENQKKPPTDGRTDTKLALEWNNLEASTSNTRPTTPSASRIIREGHVGQPVATSTPISDPSKHVKRRSNISARNGTANRSGHRKLDKSQTKKANKSVPSSTKHLALRTSPAGHVDQPATKHSPEDVKQLLRSQDKRLMGEIAFQLDRRILCYIFNRNQVSNRDGKKRFYGYIVQNIYERITAETLNPTNGEVDVKERVILQMRHGEIFNGLRKFGYQQTFHPDFSTHLVNTYGLMPTPGHMNIIDVNNLEHVRQVALRLIQVAPSREIEDVLIIFDALIQLAKNDGMDLFLMHV